MCNFLFFCVNYFSNRKLIPIAMIMRGFLQQIGCFKLCRQNYKFKNCSNEWNDFLTFNTNLFIVHKHK